MLRREGAALRPSTLQYLKPPTQLPASLSLLHAAEMATPPGPSQAHLVDSCFDHSQDNSEEGSVKGGHLLGTATLILLSWQVFSAGYIYMETRFVLGPKAARVYYPQIKPLLSPVTMIG